MDLEKATTHGGYEMRFKKAASDRNKSLVKTGQNGFRAEKAEVQR
jgi:hypothetical protein